MGRTVTMTFEEKSAVREALMSFVIKACIKPEEMPPEAMRVLPAVLETLVDYFGRW